MPHSPYTHTPRTLLTLLTYYWAVSQPAPSGLLLTCVPAHHMQPSLTDPAVSYPPKPEPWGALTVLIHWYPTFVPTLIHVLTSGDIFRLLPRAVRSHCVEYYRNTVNIGTNAGLLPDE